MKYILVIDDDEMSRFAVTTILTGLGFDYLELNSGDRAVELIHTSRPLAVITDIVMDGSDGFELLTNIKQFDKQLPVFAMSSNELYIRVAENMGADGGFLKPVGIEHVRIALDQLNIKGASI